MIVILKITNSNVQIRMTFTDSFSWCELLRSIRGTWVRMRWPIYLLYRAILVKAICFASLLSWDTYNTDSYEVANLFCCILVQAICFSFASLLSWDTTRVRMRWPGTVHRIRVHLGGSYEVARDSQNHLSSLVYSRSIQFNIHIYVD